MGIGITKQEAMKRYLRGDFDTLDKLANNPYGSTGAIYWAMRDKGWNTIQGAHGSVVIKTSVNIPEGALFPAEGGSEWHTDIRMVLEEMKYVNT